MDRPPETAPLGAPRGVLTYTEDQARQAMMIELARREKLSIRTLARRFTFSLGHMVFVGTAEMLADRMQAWFEAKAADGFTMLSPYYPGPLEAFVDDVVPILQHRGLFRTEYEGTTLRENLGIPFRPHPATLGHARAIA